ncbi:TPA: hypothetical protein ACVO3E_004575 [Vibrio diabolicus]
MSLSSGIFKRYKKKFLLDEDGLRRIEAVLTSAADKTDKDLHVIYRVEREDHRFYETSDIEVVLNDANIAGKKVNILRVELREKINAEMVAGVWFDNETEPTFYKRDVMLKVSSNDRTWALMLADEIEPQVSRLLKIKGKNYLLYVLTLCIFSVLIFKVSEFFSGDSFEPIKGFKDSFFFTAMASMAAFLLSKMAVVPKWVNDIYNNSSVFLWGEEEQEYKNRLRIKRNVHWTVFIGSLVSVGAGLAMEFLQKVP